LASKSDLAPSLAALFLTGLLWGVGYVHVPPELGTGLLVVAALVTALFCLWTGRRLAVAVGLVSIAAVAFFVVDLLVLERGVLLTSQRARFGREAPQTLRLLDFNVLHGYSHFPDQDRRAERSIRAIAALRPDVIVLQEAWRTRRHGDFTTRLAEELDMDSAFARANGNLARLGFEEGEAILSRYPIVQAMRISLEPRKPFFERRVALLAVLDLGGGETLTVVGTHLDNRKLATANAQALHLAGRLESLRPWILAGDLNAPSGGPAVAAFERLGLTDLLPGGIDHVLAPTGGAWRVESAAWTLRPEEVERLIGVRAEISDHPGILVDFVRQP
jgi:endonuclease/exonuclease/phosphatase family metal-dependent hydrolase